MVTKLAVAFFPTSTKEMSEDDTPHDESESLFGRDKAGTASQLYRRHHLLAETRQDIQQMTHGVAFGFRIVTNVARSVFPYNRCPLSESIRRHGLPIESRRKRLPNSDQSSAFFLDYHRRRSARRSSKPRNLARPSTGIEQRIQFRSILQGQLSSHLLKQDFFGLVARLVNQALQGSLAVWT